MTETRSAPVIAEENHDPVYIGDRQFELAAAYIKGMKAGLVDQ